MDRIEQKRPRLIAIVGPTATGKSDLGVEIAKKISGEVISGDSRQVYKGLDLGTGKITKKEMSGVPHHLLDIASPKRAYSVAHFQRDAQKAIKQILRREKVPIVVGGTGFYIDTLLTDMKLPDVKPNYELRKKLQKLSLSELVEKLLIIDPERLETIDQHNPARLIRAIEIATLYGPIAPVTQSSPYEILWIGLTCNQENLKERIRLRLLKRMRAGMRKEFEQLHDDGLSFGRMEMLGLEYRYGARLLQGEISREEFEEQLTREITRYAKRQMTWFKRNKHIHWFDISEKDEASKLAENWI